MDWLVYDKDLRQERVKKQLFLWSVTAYTEENIYFLNIRNHKRSISAYFRKGAIH